MVSDNQAFDKKKPADAGEHNAADEKQAEPNRLAKESSLMLTAAVPQAGEAAHSNGSIDGQTTAHKDYLAQPDNQKAASGDNPAEADAHTSDSSQGLINEIVSDGLAALRWLQRASGDYPPPARKTSPDLNEKDTFIEIPAAITKAADSNQKAEHNWRDAQGDHRLYIKDGVVTYDNTHFEKERVTRKSGDTSYEIDKKTDDIKVDKGPEHIEQKRTREGLERSLHLDQENYKYVNIDNRLYITELKSGKRLAEVTDHGLVYLRENGERVTALASGLSADAAARNGKENGTFVDEKGNLAARLKDGTIVRFLPGDKNDPSDDIISLKNGDLELQIVAGGEKFQMRNGQGSWHTLAADQLPPELRARLAGHILHLDGNQSFDLAARQLITAGSGESHLVTWQYQWHKPSVLSIENGPQVRLRDGQLEFIDPHHPDHKAVRWDCKSHELRSENALFTKSQIKLSNGDEIHTNGLIRWRNSDGTYDELDNHCNFRSASGTTIDANNRVVTSDGRSYDSSGRSLGDASVIGSPAHALAEADRASAVAAAVEGKAIIDFNDVGLLTDAQADVSTMIATCMAKGDMDSVNSLMAAQARLGNTLSFAIARAQTCAIASQMGTFSPSLLEEMQQNILLGSKREVTQ